jgi:hypothetical protein
VSSFGRDFDQRLRSGRKRNRACWLGGFEDHDIGRGVRRPERRALARVCLWVRGESSSPNAGTGPPVLRTRFEGTGLCGPGCRHDLAYSWHYDSEIPARNPHSHDVDTDLRSMVTAKTNHRT